LLDVAVLRVRTAGRREHAQQCALHALAGIHVDADRREWAPEYCLLKPYPGVGCRLDLAVGATRRSTRSFSFTECSLFALSRCLWQSVRVPGSIPAIAPAFAQAVAGLDKRRSRAAGADEPP